MRDIEWFFPERLDDVPPLLAKRGIIPHGGGTGILRMKTLRGGPEGARDAPDAGGVRGLIDLSRLPLRRFERSGGRVEIGSTLTFAEVAGRLESGHILARALGGCASTPLRNRITIGGSVALFPVWSDLMGPLIALEADVDLIGAARGTFPVTRYVAEPALRKGTLVTGVSFPDRVWSSNYYRDTRTRFDYAAFTVTVLLKKNAGKVLDARVVVIGCKGKFSRLLELEERLKGKPLGAARDEAAGASGAGDGASGGGTLPIPTLPFGGRKFMSPEYLAHCARVELERGLKSLMGEERR
jgi:CO/xanthine dehydrogenase FAD-binding subunit